MNSKNAVYCIILTKYRLLQGFAMYRSLEKNTTKLTVYFLCMDSETYDILQKLNLKNVVLLSLKQIECEELLEVKAKRKLNEYCWTLKPYFLDFLLCNVDNLSRVTYLDADLYFFNDPERIFEDAPYCSILLTKHNYAYALEQISADYGKFNSGFISVRNCLSGIDCIRWWKRKCLGWCSEAPENGRFGDQKYLDAIPFYFKRAGCAKTPGVNIAPWNQAKYSFSVKNDKVYANDKPLIFYHFSGLRLMNKETAALTIHYEKEVIPVVYKPYLIELQKAAAEIHIVNPEIESFFIEDNPKNVVATINIKEI